MKASATPRLHGAGADYRLQAEQLDRGIGQSEAHLRLVRALSFRTKATRSRAAAGNLP